VDIAVRTARKKSNTESAENTEDGEGLKALERWVVIHRATAKAEELLVAREAWHTACTAVSQLNGEAARANLMSGADEPT